MTPVEELRAAVTRLRCDHDFSFVERGCAKCGADTRPVVDELVEPLATWLESWDKVNSSEHGPHSEDWAAALSIARVVTGGGA